MAAGRSHSLFTTLVLLALTGTTQGKSFDEILGTENLIFYMSIAFLGLSVLFFFAVLLSIIIVSAKIQKMNRNNEKHEMQTKSTVVSNMYALSQREQSLSDPAIWDEYLSRDKQTRNAKDGGNENFKLYVETFRAHDADGIQIPRAQTVNGRKH